MSDVNKNPAARLGNATRFNKKYGDVKVEALGKGAPNPNRNQSYGRKNAESHGKNIPIGRDTFDPNRNQSYGRKDKRK